MTHCKICNRYTTSFEKQTNLPWAARIGGSGAKLPNTVYWLTVSFNGYAK